MGIPPETSNSPTTNPRAGLRPRDALVLVALFGITLLFAARGVDFSVEPCEDAAMLMRYAEHLAGGHGIVWNVGEKPVDGATDFLFMVVVAAARHLGLALVTATRAVGFVSHLLTVALVYLAIRRRLGAGVLPAAFSALYLAVGPGLHYVAACFGTPFFALAGALTFLAALRIARDGPSTRRNLAFAIPALITGLIRPEGVILALLVLAAIPIRIGLGRARSTILTFAGVFAVLGGAYFAWRWSYFGHPLPNPFYRKGDFSGVFRHGKRSLFAAAWMCLPFLPAFVLGFRSAPLRRRSLFALVPAVGFAAAFAVISDAMNFGDRFQYAVLPIVLLSWYPLVRDVRADFSLPARRSLPRGARCVALALALLLAAGSIRFIYRTGRATYGPEGLAQVGRMLADYGDRGYSVATTEAGLIPLFSGWRALDAWGLNDPWIARHGGVTKGYLERFDPDVIVFHSRVSIYAGTAADDEWEEMVRVLADYAGNRGYRLAAVFGDSPHDTHTYYVRAGLPDAEEIAERIRDTPYAWSATGRRAVDFAHLPPIRR